MGTPEALSLGVKQRGREAKPPLPQYASMAWRLVKKQAEGLLYCTFTLLYFYFTRDSFPRDKAAGREADHSSPSSAEVKDAWSCTSTTQYALMA